MNEIILSGTGVSTGLALAPLYRMHKTEYAATVSAATDPATETARFYKAVETAGKELEALAQKLKARGEDEAAELFETHAELCADPDFTDCVSSAIEAGSSAAKAVYEAGGQFAAMFENMDDAYMQQRATDIRDVAERLCSCLSKRDAWTEPCTEYILSAEDLSPSETVSLSREKLKGILLEKGTANGHTAILARLMGIPAVIALGEGLLQVKDGTPVAIDGEKGIAAIAPSPAAVQEYSDRMQKDKLLREQFERVRGLEDLTSDGRQLHIRCSIGKPEDMQAVRENDGRGIGLFRSEFLYLGRKAMPTEEEQFEAYRSVLCAAGGEPVTVRTADIGADKRLDYLEQAGEENPALGLRGLRLSLCHTAMLRTQLRALYRASVYGRLQIMFPMVANVWEAEEVRRICRELISELENGGTRVDEAVPLGVMIETPAAALISDRLARVCDFFSIGTNDLTQYTLACDRQNQGLAPHCPPHHEAVMRLIRMTAENAHKAGIPVGICGELGADEGLLPEFVNMGIDEISVAPSKVLFLRSELRKL